MNAKHTTQTKETVHRMSQLEGKNSDLQSRLQKLRGATLGPGADRNAAGSGSSPDSSPSRDLAVDGRSVRPGSRRDGSSNASAGAGASSQTGGGRRGGSHMTAPRVLAQMAALARMQLLREERDKALDRRRQACFFLFLLSFFLFFIHSFFLSFPSFLLSFFLSFFLFSSLHFLFSSEEICASMATRSPTNMSEPLWLYK